MKTLAEYQQDISQADRVRRLVNCAEFETLKGILKRMSDRDIENLLSVESPEARFRIKCFKDIHDEIQQDIDLGKIAADAIAEGKFLESPQGG